MKYDSYDLRSDRLTIDRLYHFSLNRQMKAQKQILKSNLKITKTKYLLAQVAFSCGKCFGIAFRFISLNLTAR